MHVDLDPYIKSKMAHCPGPGECELELEERPKVRNSHYKSTTVPSTSERINLKFKHDNGTTPPFQVGVV